MALPIHADRIADWREDVATLLTDLQRDHPRFRQCGLPDEITTRAAALKGRLPTMSDEAIAAEIQRILALAGDGHTLLWPFGMQKLPVTLWWFDDGVYVVDGQYARNKVTHIGGLPVEEVFRRLDPFISHDNEMQFRWAVPFYATMPAFLAAVNVEPVLTFQNGQTAAPKAAPIDPAKLELKLIPPARRGETFRSERISPGVLYVAVNSMSPAARDFGVKLRAELAKTDRAILDLRLNNGGDASNADELLKTFIAFDTRGGKFVTLISRMTFSAAETFAARLDQWTTTVFAGEATGSRPNHYGNERPFRLPHSGLRGSISSGWNQPVTARDDRDAIRPEIAVPQTAQDFFSGKDRTLETALQQLASPQK
jgi:hypothetical protein